MNDICVVLTDYLPGSSVLALAQTSKSLFSTLSPFINLYYYFWDTTTLWATLRDFHEYSIFSSCPPVNHFAWYQPTKIITTHGISWSHTNLENVQFKVVPNESKIYTLRFKEKTDHIDISDWIPPPVVKQVIFDHKWTKFFHYIAASPNLTHLTFNFRYEDPLSISPSLQYLQLPLYSNRPLPDLPDTLTTLIFKSHTTRVIAYLPPRLHTLVLPPNYTLGLPARIPALLRDLTASRASLVSEWKDQFETSAIARLTLLHPTHSTPLPPLPKKLAYLCLEAKNFDFFPATRLPPTLKFLVQAKYSFDCLPNTWPPTLTHLTVGRVFKKIVVWPPALTHLTCSKDFDHQLHSPIPTTVTHLRVKRGNFVLSAENLPPTLRHFSYKSYDIAKSPYAKLSGLFPPTLTGLFLDMFLSAPQLPPTLTHLVFNSDFNSPLRGSLLPLPLTHLAFGRQFNQTVDYQLPNTLETLVLGFSFTQPVNSLSCKLVRLYLASYSDVTFHVLPSNHVLALADRLACAGVRVIFKHLGKPNFVVNGEIQISGDLS